MPYSAKSHSLFSNDRYHVTGKTVILLPRTDVVAAHVALVNSNLITCININILCNIALEFVHVLVIFSYFSFLMNSSKNIRLGSFSKQPAISAISTLYPFAH